MEHRFAARRFRSDASGNARAVGDAGYALAMTALLILPLLVATAFATDYGAWLAQAAKLQRAADNAAMAGVVYMPNDSNAQSAAANTLSANGYVLSGTNKNVTASYPSTGYEQRFRVELKQAAPQYFSRLLMNGINITRGATAEYNKPVPLGSPTNNFGNNINPANCPQSQPTSSAPCGPLSMLWAAIQGPYRQHESGDPFATKCSGAGPACDDASKANGAQNAEYRNTGYDYAIDVPAAAVGQPITVQVYDASTIQRSTGSGTTYDCNRSASPWSGSFPSGFSQNNCQTGDIVEGLSNVGSCGNYSPCPYPNSKNLNFEAQVFDNDGSDVTVTFGSILSGCDLKVLNNISLTTATNTYKNKWANVCTFTPTKAGIYPLRVKSSGISGVADTGDGYNAYALRATSSGGTNPKFYALNDMSIWTNTPGTTAKFYLAEIKPEHAGKKVRIDLFDPGDGSGTFKMTLRGPAGGAPAAIPANGTAIPDPTGSRQLVTSCKRSGATVAQGTAAANTNMEVGPSGVGGTCTVTTSTSGSSTYNDRWLRIEIQLATTYDCGPAAATGYPTDCWWTVQYDFGSASSGVPYDRTTWALEVVGDPVHLVE